MESIQITVLESMPAQVRVLAQVSLRDSCTKLDQVRQERTGAVFTVVITTVRQANAACAAVIVPAEAAVPLDVHGLEAGTYAVVVNGVSGSFVLTSDNLLIK